MTHSSSLKEKGDSEISTQGCLDVIKADLLTVQIEKLSHREGETCPRSRISFG